MAAGTVWFIYFRFIYLLVCCVVGKKADDILELLGWPEGDISLLAHYTIIHANTVVNSVPQAPKLKRRAAESEGVAPKAKKLNDDHDQLENENSEVRYFLNFWFSRIFRRLK